MVDRMEEDEYELTKRLKEAEWIDLGGSEVVERTGDEKRVEIEEMPVKVIELDSVTETVGYEGDEEFKPKKPKRIKKVEVDPWVDYKRNFSEYRFFCTKCLSTGVCQRCGGRGRVKLILKCPDCGGSGKCSHCNEEYKIECPSCGAEMSRFADTCYSCGRTNYCPVCNARLPFAATRCPSCGMTFRCRVCGSSIAPGMHTHCPHCGQKFTPVRKRLK